MICMLTRIPSAGYNLKLLHLLDEKSETITMIVNEIVLGVSMTVHQSLQVSGLLPESA